MNRTEIAQQFFAKDKFATQVTGVKIEEVTEEMVTCSLKVTEHHKNAAGMVMGGVLFTLADFAFAVAANMEVVEHSDGGNLWVSLESNIHYLSVMKGDTLLATTECVKKGRTTCLYLIKITDNTERLICTVSTTGVRPDTK